MSSSDSNVTTTTDTSGTSTTKEVGALRPKKPRGDQVRPVARNHRRRILRQLRLSPRDLDPVGRGYLDLFCRLSAKIDLLEQHLAEHGLLKADGELQPALKQYVALANAARLALARLEAHVGDRAMSPSAVLDVYLESRYGDDDAA